MFSTKTFVAFLVFATPFLVRADAVPVTPAPGDIFVEGSMCTLAWTGDTSSTTLWKNMAIELMAGSNEDMEFITTVATGQDGTVSNTYSYPCPNVTPNSPIYFYQFTAPLAKNLTWTGRFAIVATAGATPTPASDNTTEADGTVIHWGKGALVDPSTAIAPPSFAASISMSSSIASNSSTSAIVTSSTAASNIGSSAAATTDVTASDTNSSPEPSSTSASSSAQPTSGAMTTTFDIRVLWVAAAATLVLSFV